jgi:hypothetical protein
MRPAPTMPHRPRSTRRITLGGLALLVLAAGFVFGFLSGSVMALPLAIHSVLIFVFYRAFSAGRPSRSE